MEDAGYCGIAKVEAGSGSGAGDVKRADCDMTGVTGEYGGAGGVVEECWGAIVFEGVWSVM